MISELSPLRIAISANLIGLNQWRAKISFKFLLTFQLIPIVCPSQAPMSPNIPTPQPTT